MAREPKKTVQQIAKLRKAEDLVREYPGVHPNALRRVRPGAKYVSRGRDEYEILEQGNMWRVNRVFWGSLPRTLKGSFTSFTQCEQALIKHLKSTDRFNKARYPGSEQSSDK